jgi:D-alanyl-D-alanine carboxypeptidase (penicillin-binding protein 5/6)
MRRWMLVVLATLALAGPLLAEVRRALAFETEVRAAVLIDFRTGAVLFAKDADVPLPPASMSKLMTANMVFERLKDGTLRLDDTLPVSERAWRTGGSKMFVKVGDRVPVDDLLHGIIIQSGNDACVVVAEALAGSEAAFAERMNQRARELGLANTNLMNATGLPDPQHRMSVRDLALLARHIIAEFPEFYRFYSETEFTYAGIRQYNRNPLLQKGVPGVDGMKTGHTDEAGYGLVTSALRDGQRLILVIAGAKSPRSRASEAERLLEYGFREFQHYKLFAPGETVQEADVWLGGRSRVPLVAPGGVAVTMSREARKEMVVRLVYHNPIPAPIAQGQVLAELQVTAPGLDVMTFPLVAASDVPQAGMLGKVTSALGYLIWGAS